MELGTLMDFDAFFSMDEWLLGWDFHGFTQRRFSSVNNLHLKGCSGRVVCLLGMFSPNHVSYGKMRVIGDVVGILATVVYW